MRFCVSMGSIRREKPGTSIVPRTKRWSRPCGVRPRDTVLSELELISRQVNRC